MQSLYEWDFYEQQQGSLDEILERNIQEFGPGLEDTNKDFVRKLVYGVKENIDQINQIIEKAAPEWPLNQITIIDRNVLRLGLYELIYGSKEAPQRKLIDRISLVVALLCLVGQILVITEQAQRRGRIATMETEMAQNQVVLQGLLERSTYSVNDLISPGPSKHSY